MRPLNEASLKAIDDIVMRHRNQQGPAIEMLHEVQDQLGCIPFEAMERIADATGTSVANIYGIVTFYAAFTTEPKGKHVVNVCLGTACYVKGSRALAEKLEEETGAKLNSTSPDGLFSLDATRCLGACGLAPVCIIDGKVHGNALLDDTVINTIRRIKEQEAAA
ncbi:MAG: NAD(P)H-dependent oxidoreductase subunit E [Bulleidia sp.]|nr:NAD(P)H-dependent oxidoreductase subunit E [Bulleidia sp.]